MKSFLKLKSNHCNFNVSYKQFLLIKCLLNKVVLKKSNIQKKYIQNLTLLRSVTVNKTARVQFFIKRYFKNIIIFIKNIENLGLINRISLTNSKFICIEKKKKW